MGNIILIIDKKHCKSFKLAPFCLNPFCYMFYVSILRLVTYYVPLNRKYGGNYLKYLFELYSFLFFSFYWENLLKRTFFTNLNKSRWRAGSPPWSQHPARFTSYEPCESGNIDFLNFYVNLSLATRSKSHVTLRVVA